jgi:hypothetical protein
MKASLRRATSALTIALEREDHAMVLLLLYNGYEPDLENRCPLSQVGRKYSWLAAAPQKSG